jgi:hypothetical protein
MSAVTPQLCCPAYSGSIVVGLLKLIFTRSHELLPKLAAIGK